MKLMIVTPLHIDSAIGRMNAAVGAALVEMGCQVSFLRSEMTLEPGEPRHRVIGPVYYWRDVDLGLLARKTDLAIVHLGDNYAFHAGAFAALDAMPCLGVFHDFYAYNLFNGWLADHGYDERRRDAEVIDVYGEVGLAALKRLREGRLEMAGIAAAIPMTEWLARRCSGAVAHAQFYEDRLKAACPGPVNRITLCAPDRKFPPRRRRGGHDLTVVTVGVMNTNKCADAVIDAIGRLPDLKARLQYRLVGAISAAERERLTELAAKVDFHGLSIEGAASEEEFAAALADADIVCCLRKPVLEGASGSVIDGLLAGRPVIVADAGFYGELPDDVVFKISADLPADELAASLARLAEDRALRQAVGRRARLYAERTFSPQAYARALMAAAAQTLEHAPQHRVAAKFGRRLDALGASASDSAGMRVTAMLKDLFQPSLGDC